MNGSGVVWDQVFCFVITPDQTMDGAVRQALAKIGIPDEHVFTEPIPSDMNTGLDEESDDFLTVLRYAMPDDGGAEGTRSNAWRERLPLVVLRIRDTRSAHKPKTYPPVEFEARFGTSPPEIDLKPDLVELAKDREASFHWKDEEIRAAAYLPLEKLEKRALGQSLGRKARRRVVETAGSGGRN